MLFGDPPTLASGSSGSAVTTLQQDLNALGYGVAVDGQYGPGTTTAITQYQADNGLPQTGVADAATWASIGGSPLTSVTLPDANNPLPAAAQPSSSPTSFVASLMAAPKQAAAAIVPAGSPSWVMPVAIGAVSLGGALLLFSVGRAIWRSRHGS